MSRYGIGCGLAVLAASLVGGAAPAAAESVRPKIEWQTNLWAAYQQATREGKPLVVYFYTDSCDYCDKMVETLADARVQQLAGKAIFVRVNGDKDEDAKGNVGRLMQQLKVDRFPSVAVLQPYTDKIVELGLVSGYFPPENFVPRLENYLGQAADSKK